MDGTQFFLYHRDASFVLRSHFIEFLVSDDSLFASHFAEIRVVAGFIETAVMDSFETSEISNLPKYFVSLQ
jgi:hypothetical protein